MAIDGNFEKLASGLSLSERQGLLEKLNDHSTLAKGPLYFEDDKAAAVHDIQTEFSNLPWYYRFWYFIFSFFRSVSPVKIFEEKSLVDLGHKVQERGQGLYDHEKALFLPGFYRSMQRLKEAAHFFYAALDSSVNRDRGAFFAFLGSLEMPNVHNKLNDETLPEFIAGKYPDMQESELRQMAHRTMDDALAMITEEYRNDMYFSARTLNCLKELSSFLYDRVLMAFSVNKAYGGEVCYAGVVRDLLINLNNMLFSLKASPPLTLLESLFIFILQERASEQNFDINKEIQLLLSKAEDSLVVIRDFNRKVPLTWILRCSSRNMSLSPKEISGGEEWFAIYRDHWKRRIDSIFADYMKDRLQRDLQTSFTSFLNGKELKKLENAQSPANPDGIPIKGSFALSFLYTFYSAVFMPDINVILRPILIDGDWQKKENRVEYTEAYNNLIKLEDEIKKLEQEISLTGDYGQRYHQAKQEMSPLPVKRKKVQIVVEEASEEAERILEQAKDACESISYLLNGILGIDPKNKYGQLTNLAKLSGGNAQFSSDIGEIIIKFKKVLKILEDVESMESGK